ncbi:MAG: pyruvate kinase [Saprospiraceae bacterium]|nr:pyruvate kinase [Saprospiraceae bacterium]MDW8228556.1 pyruvate kinase [Saprospiraceae bacterium]
MKTADMLRDALLALRADMLHAEREHQALLQSVHPQQHVSARNLLHYLSLRCHDLRDLQDDLHNAGLSSLASCESHALHQVEAVLKHLGQHFSEGAFCDYPTARRILQQRATALFGPKVNPHIPHLMVTFDTDMAENYAQVKAFLLAGMNVARINCAHDDPDTWLAMIRNVRKAMRATGRPCKIYADLAGPKIRTVLLAKGRKKGRLKVSENERFLLADEDAALAPDAKAIGCTLPGAVAALRPGDRVLFDDGLYEAVVEKAEGSIASLRLVRASAAKPRLRAEKGINFPDTVLPVTSLTEFDRSVLPFIAQYADIVGFSFVQRAEDVAELQTLLRQYTRRPLPIVLKMETFEAVQNLPSLLFQGMHEATFGVMIARGDLAVEIGFERMSEIQEEILWLCEAAHAPVVWATQVLETQAKSGVATRSEVTDAARAAHAECVMLNKGRYMLAVLDSLRDILHRSGGHHLKKRYIFRPLSIAEGFFKRTSTSPNTRPAGRRKAKSREK